MEVNLSLPMELTSTVIPPHVNGNYPFNVTGFLLPHEMIRRDMRRAQLALDALNSCQAPWKARAFKEWIIDYFLPIMRVHHYIEDEIIFPFYSSLDCVIPDRQFDDHAVLLGQFHRIKSAAETLVKMVDSADNNQLSDPAEIEAIRNQESVLKVEFANMVTHCKAHFEEEEVFWSPILLQCGVVSVLIFRCSFRCNNTFVRY